ncbi:MAG TPA: TetR/AcrR family transcriptional regulator [Solirubrobacteraceae bacterium]|nr:TetR/AcrR family transcriptional regulator [Solirubrobacteraceae bacterium]
MGADSRERMVQSAAMLLGEHGLAGASFREVLEHSGAPRGSIYHHFPGGKSQLSEEAVGLAGELGQALIADAGRDAGPIEALRAFVRTWRAALESSEFRAGCPVVAVTTAASAEEPRLTTAAAAVFASWEQAIAEPLRDAGLTQARARRIATLAVASVEGAVVLCRAQRNSRPLRDVGIELEQLLISALPNPNRSELT